MSDPVLQQKLEALLKRKELLEAKLANTRANEAGSTRKNETKYQVSSTRAVQARGEERRQGDAENREYDDSAGAHAHSAKAGAIVRLDQGLLRDCSGVPVHTGDARS